LCVFNYKERIRRKGEESEGEEENEEEERLNEGCVSKTGR
jgi:hypothetical protein